MGKKTNLKATFSNHQEKQRKAQVQKAKEAAKKDILKKIKSEKAPSAKSGGKRRQEQSNSIPINSSDTILLIGEGNFSFARALFISGHSSLQSLPPENVVATTYDSEEDCYVKYPDAMEIVRDLRERSVTVLFDIDARRLETFKEIKKRRWQRVIWNFPHAGKGITDQDRNVLSNQILVLDFLKSVAPLLEEGAAPNIPTAHNRRRREEEVSSGEEDCLPDNDVELDATVPYSRHSAPAMKQRGTVLITLRNTKPYTLWDLPRLAKKPPSPHSSSYSPLTPQPRYVQFRSFAFNRNDYKGYEHRMTKGWVEGLGTGADKASKDQKGVEDRTWEFLSSVHSTTFPGDLLIVRRDDIWHHIECHGHSCA